MTFDEIVQNTMDRLNLTSLEARERVEGTVNRIYKKATSSVGIQTSRQVSQLLEIDPTDVDSTLPEYTVQEMEKITRLIHFITTDPEGRFRVLDEMPYNELVNITTADRAPRYYAIKRMGANEITFVLDAFPAAETFTLKADGYDHLAELVADAEPFMPTDYHDLLIEGAMSDELRKMEKPQLAAIAESNYQTRLSDLRMFIAKSIYLDIYQGKDDHTIPWAKARRYWE